MTPRRFLPACASMLAAQRGVGSALDAIDNVREESHAPTLYGWRVQMAGSEGL